MIYNAPAFWARYRGEVDPQRPNTTEYRYTAYFFLSSGGTLDPNGLNWADFSPIVFTVLGPPQLSKKDYVEIRWTYVPGLIRIIIANPIGLWFYTSNGAEQGFRDEGQYNFINGGVTNQ